jgi:hypothetical protein
MADQEDVNVTAAEMKVLERAFAAEIVFRRFQSKSKLIPGMIEKGLLTKQEERDGMFHCEWLELTHLGRLLYCSSCEGEIDPDDEP